MLQAGLIWLTRYLFLVIAFFIANIKNSPTDYLCVNLELLHNLMHFQMRFTSYSGSKDGLENLAYLPTTVMKMLNGTQPVLAQWNYAILCHPLSDDLQLSRLHIVDDLKTRMALGGVNMEQYEASRTARFQVFLTPIL